ncbi:putative antitoxin VapB24 [Mycobacterium xenopi 3993]|nr:putative antitoxin VapB24 [Mycobacterium xenopi 3993]
MTLAEVIRRGLEHMVQIYPRRDVASDTWQPPTPRRLGPFRVSADAWRELANEA